MVLAPAQMAAILIKKKCQKKRNKTKKTETKSKDSKKKTKNKKTCTPVAPTGKPASVKGE